MVDPDYRIRIKGILRKFSLHKVCRQQMLNDLCDEINVYYTEEVVASKSHEKQLKEQLDGLVNYLTDVRNEMDNKSHYGVVLIEGFDLALQQLKDIANK